MYTFKRICFTDRKQVEGDFLSLISEISEGKADYIILREKDLSSEEYEALSKKVIEICRKGSAELILHSFTDVCRKLNYPHVHLPMGKFLSLTKEERKLFETLGVSTHSVEEALTAERLGATYITASHIFETDCKKGLEPRGLEYLREVAEKTNIPCYALGGISPNNEKKCIEAGADGVCMMSEYMKGKI